MSLEFIVFIALVLTSMASSLVGVFLLLKNMSMLSDAIAHTILLGIILAYFYTKDLDSPLLIISATLFGVITVIALEMLVKTKLIKSDAAVGVIFSSFFSLSIILISKFLKNSPLSTNTVIMGNVLNVPLSKIKIFSNGQFPEYYLNICKFLNISPIELQQIIQSIPKMYVIMGIIFLIDLIYVIVFYKELKISSFDENYSILTGFSVVFLQYSLMFLVSLTAVASFKAVGAILVISFMITPVCSAYLITKDLKNLIIISFIYGIINSAIGCRISFIFKCSTSGTVAVVSGITFFITFLCNKDGLLYKLITKKKKKKELNLDLLLVHIYNHIDKQEQSIEDVSIHLNWNKNLTSYYIDELQKRNLINKTLEITDKGLSKVKLISKQYNVRLLD